MTRVHALVVVVLLLTVLIHATLAGLLRLVARRPGSRKDTSSSPPGIGTADLVTKDRRLDLDPPVRGIHPHKTRRGVAIYGTCAGCGLPISMTHSTRRGLRS
jgi:hypothetical protein